MLQAKLEVGTEADPSRIPAQSELSRRLALSLCATSDFDEARHVLSIQVAAHLATPGTEKRHAIIRTLKLIRRCATPAQQVQVRDELATLLGRRAAAALWAEAGTAFGGYTGMYPGYAPDIQERLTELGASETVAFGSFALSSSGPAHRSRARALAASEVPELARTDILYFRGHQFAQYRAPGLFSDGEEEYGFDLRYIERVGGFPNVKLLISTSCATLCKEAFEVFHGLFPNAVILGYRRSAPLEGAAVRASFQASLKALRRPLLLEQAIDIGAIISTWKSVVETTHARQRGPQPGYCDGSAVHYWDGGAWRSVGAMAVENRCKQKEDFRDQYPAPD